MGEAPRSSGIGAGGKIKEYVKVESVSGEKLKLTHVKDGSQVKSQTISLGQAQNPSSVSFEFLNFVYGPTSKAWLVSASADAAFVAKNYMGYTYINYMQQGWELTRWSPSTVVNYIFFTTDKKTTVGAITALTEYL